MCIRHAFAPYVCNSVRFVCLDVVTVSNKQYRQYVHAPHALVLQLGMGIFERRLPLLVCPGHGWCGQLVPQRVETRGLLVILYALQFCLQQRVFLL